jgi:hypothetical protein
MESSSDIADVKRNQFRMRRRLELISGKGIVQIRASTCSFAADCYYAITLKPKEEDGTSTFKVSLLIYELKLLT